MSLGSFYLCRFGCDARAPAMISPLLLAILVPCQACASLLRHDNVVNSSSTNESLSAPPTLRHTAHLTECRYHVGGSWRWPRSEEKHA